MASGFRRTFGVTPESGQGGRQRRVPRCSATTPSSSVLEAALFGIGVSGWSYPAGIAARSLVILDGEGSPVWEALMRNAVGVEQAVGIPEYRCTPAPDSITESPLGTGTGPLKRPTS